MKPNSYFMAKLEKLRHAKERKLKREAKAERLDMKKTNPDPLAHLTHIHLCNDLPFSKHKQTGRIQKKPKPKRLTRKKLIKQMDALVSQIVIKRDGRCVICRSKQNLTCGHYVKRGKIQLRWDLINCNCQCAPCNYRHNQYPEAYTQYMLNHWGVVLLNNICQRSKLTHSKISMDQLLVKYKYFKDLEQELAKLKGGKLW